MEKFLFVYNWLSALTDGRFFRTTFSGILRITAIVFTIYLLGDAIENGQRMVDLPAGASLLLPILSQLLLLLAGYMVIHLLLLRAAEIRSLYDPRYALSEVVTVLARLSGEVLFVATLAATLLTLLQIEEVEVSPWLNHLQQMIAPLLKQTTEVWILVSGLTLSFLLLIAGYLSSEVLEMVMKLSRNSEQK
ncbi:MAG: hypothetical protein HN842_03210 [Gammaproteobacteria bacterium]|nr:hypothetical protein [Gammaproteobacteria bacterium]